jgi:outer membrane protein TolC
MTLRLSFLICTLTLVGVVAVASLAAAQDTQDMRLSLRETIDMALENNLDIVVSRLNTQIQGENIGAARGALKPFLLADLNNLDSRTPANNQLVGAAALRQKVNVYNITWMQELSLGTNYNITFENRRLSTNSAFSSFNPLFDAAVSAQIAQPLLRNLGLNPNKQRIVVAQNGERFARFQFESRVMDVVRDVEIAYWDLVQAIRGLEVAEKSLELAQDLRRNNRIQVEVGTMAPIDVLQADAEVAAREESVILTIQAIQNTEDLLKRLINDPSSEKFWQTTVIPVDQPSDAEVEIDVDASVQTALQRRPELDQSRTELDTRGYNVRYTRNQLRPQVDIVGSLAFSGLGGNEFIRDDFAGSIVDEIPGGYTDALKQLGGRDFRDWSLGLRFSYPMGHSTESARHAQAQVEFRQQRATIESQELIVAQQVRVTARAVDTNRKRIQTTRVARELSQERLEAEEKKFEVGMSTSFFIVQAQRDLTEAAANELRALIDYNKALVEFERARGTLLDRDNISVR